LQEGGDRLAVGRFLHGADEGHHRGEHVATGRGGNGGPLFQKGQYRIRPAPHLAQSASGIKIVIDVIQAEHGQSFGHAVLEYVGDLPETTVEAVPIAFHQRVLVFGFGHVHPNFSISPNTPSFPRRRESRSLSQ
jgi:hypothetical protein